MSGGHGTHKELELLEEKKRANMVAMFDFDEYITHKEMEAQRASYGYENTKNGHFGMGHREMGREWGMGGTGGCGTIP